MTTQTTTDASTKSRARSRRTLAIGSVSDQKPAPTKAATIRKLMTRTRGATMGELATASGWQPHSLRAFMSGLRKSGAQIVRESRKSGEQAYRLVSEADSSAPASAMVEANAGDADAGTVASEVA